MNGLLSGGCNREEILFVQNFISLNIRNFQTNGPHRKYYKFNSENTPIINSIKNRLINYFKIEDHILDPIFNDFIGYIEESGFVHAHRDRDVYDRRHVRINCMILKPDRGGDPVIQDSVIPVNVGDCWINFASLTTHGSTPAEGSNPRSVLSLGLQVRRDIADDLYSRVRY